MYRNTALKEALLEAGFVPGRFQVVNVLLDGGPLLHVSSALRWPRKGQFQFNSRTGVFRFSAFNKGGWLVAQVRDNHGPAYISQWTGRLLSQSGTKEMRELRRLVDTKLRIVGRRFGGALDGVPVPENYEAKMVEQDRINMQIAIHGQLRVNFVDRDLLDRLVDAGVIAGKINAPPILKVSHSAELTAAEVKALLSPYYPLKCHIEVKDQKMSMHTHCAIVGAGYHTGASEQLRRLDDLVGRKGFEQGLILVREPNNPYDQNAVSVHVRFREGGQTRTQMLGFITRQDAKVVSKVIDNGVDVRALYKKGSIAELWWPAETKQGVDDAYRRAMDEELA